jgi:hypothetical protein
MRVHKGQLEFPARTRQRLWYACRAYTAYFSYKEDGGWDLVDAGDPMCSSLTTQDLFGERAVTIDKEKELSKCCKTCDEFKGYTKFLFLKGQRYPTTDFGATPEFMGSFTG